MKNNFNLKNAAIIFAVAITLLQSACRKEDDIDTPDQIGTVTSNDAEKYSPGIYDAGVLSPWYTLLNKLIIQTPGHTPPIVAREIGYIGITLYESTVARGGGHQSLAGQLTGLSPLPARPYNAVIPPISGNAALAKIIKSLYGNASAANVATIDSLELALDAQYSVGHTTTVLVKARQFGKDVADAIFNNFC